MQRPRTRTLAVAAAALLVAGGAGGAVAATKLGTPKEESQAVIDDAAQQLGVAPAKLDQALRKALADRVDRAVASGKLTKEQGDALKARIQSADTPLFGGPRGGPGPGHRHGLGPAGSLSAAADYLGMKPAEVRAALRDGKTLADLAKARDKSVDGLVAALVADATKRIDAAVAAGRLTDAQAKELKANLTERVTDLVNGELRRGFRPRFGPELRPGRSFGFRFRDGAAPAPREGALRIFS